MSNVLLALAGGVLVTVAAAAPFFIRQRRRLRETERSRAALEDSVDLFQGTFEGLADGLYRFDAETGAESCSPRMAVLLNLQAGTDATYGDILERFDPVIARRLDRSIQGLRGEGRAFEILLPISDSSRMVQAMGTRSLTPRGRPLADYLWMRDVSDSIGALGQVMLERHIGREDGARIPSEGSRFRSLAEAMSVPVWLRDTHLAMSFANRACPEGDPSRDLAACAVTEARAVTETRLLTIKGRKVAYDVTEVPLNDGLGTAGFALPRGVAPVANGDAGGNGDAEFAVLSGLTTGVAVFGRDGGLRYANAAFAELWRLDPVWLGKKPAYGDILARLRENRRLPEVADFRAYREEQLRLFDSLAEPQDMLLHLPDGTSVRRLVAPHPSGGVIFNDEDVSERLELESSYQVLTAVQRETLDNLYEGIAVFGSDGRLELCNPAFITLWGLEDADLPEQPHLAELVDITRGFYRAGDADWSSIRDTMVGRFMSRDTVTGRLERTDDTILDYAAVPLPDGGVLLSYLDVTDSAQVERALRERAEALSGADRLRSEFIANLSYELRTPLNTILGFAELLAEEYFGTLNARQKEYGRGIREAANGMVTMLGDIIDLTTIEAGQMHLELDTVDLHAVMAGVLGLIRERAKQRGLDLEFDCSPEIGWVVADEKRLKQVLYHLLSNAVKFTPSGGEVRLSGYREDGQVTISVSDTGVGIPLSDQERVFEGFQRGETADRHQTGAGLGLTLVKRFIELHGGTVNLRSAPNKGTTVRCILPS
ncbi:MAG: ATP-binding protein [Rhodospirillales bacterium]|nr:ATP-binding protein [Rhodospirillales bacterium]